MYYKFRGEALVTPQEFLGITGFFMSPRAPVWLSSLTEKALQEISGCFSIIKESWSSSFRETYPEIPRGALHMQGMAMQVLAWKHRTERIPSVSCLHTRTHLPRCTPGISRFKPR